MPWEPLPGSPPAGPTPVAESVAGLLRHLGAPPPDVQARVEASWEQLVGPALAERATPSGVRDETLLVTVDDPAWATQIRFSATDILARLHDLVGPVATAVDVRVRRR